MSLQPLRPMREQAPRRSFATKNHLAFTYPAPTAGLDYMTPLGEMDPKAAITLSNVLQRSYGSEFRAGWARWASLIPGEVRTLMPYNPPRGLTSPPATAKLFAACSDGKIYDVTLQTNEVTVPPVSATIPGQLEPGEFSWTNFATITNNFLCVCSAGGGYWTYDATGGWINRTASITGAGSTAAIDFDFVMSWKNRLWFVKNQTADTYFLGVNNITGASTSFDFGPLLIHGGDIKAMASWSVDSGDGIDDKLVIVGSEGDLLIYAGTDPTSASSFGIQGRWFVGRVPNGRRFISRYGGDTMIISQFGIAYLSRLLQRPNVSDPQAQASHKINPIFSKFVTQTILEQYWEIRFLGQLECIFVNAPDSLEIKNRQFVMDVNSKAWSTFDGIPMLTCENFGGVLYFGTVDGKVGKAFESSYATDGILSDGTLGNDITIQVQSAYVPGGDPVRLKRLLHGAVTFQGQLAPTISAQINSDWSFNTTPGAPTFNSTAGGVWDAGLWDVALWSGGIENTFKGWFGAEGLGYYAGLRFSARGYPRTVFTDWTLISEEGGLM